MENTRAGRNALVKNCPIRKVLRMFTLFLRDSLKTHKGFSDGKPKAAKPRPSQLRRVIVNHIKIKRLGILL